MSGSGALHPFLDRCEVDMREFQRISATDELSQAFWKLANAPGRNQGTASREHAAARPMQGLN
jgi:hypothetical protein